VKSVKQKVKTIVKNYTNSSAATLINKLNPILRGWANYFNSGA
jgi:hypothetical protein